MALGYCIVSAGPCAGRIGLRSMAPILAAPTLSVETRTPDVVLAKDPDRAG
jgi:hypothetical protein